MRRFWLFVFSACFLLFCVSTLGQSPSSEQGMQALVAEVRQLRKDLQASNENALKAQILLARLQFQEEAVVRASQHLNNARGMLADTQRHLKETAATLKQFEESLENNTEMSPGDRKQVQYEVSRNKAELETLTAEEQQRQTAESQAEEQLRTEQAKLNDLEERVDRLEKALDNPG